MTSPLSHRLAEEIITDQKPSYVFAVERSITQRPWVFRDYCPRLALSLSQKLNQEEIIGRMLASRHPSLETIHHFLNPTLRDLLPDPSHLKDMDQAVTRTLEAVRSKQTITIFGDYDVDGATSSALLYRFLKSIGATVNFYIPDRLSEGYGPSTPALTKLHQQGTNLLITVDCGTTAFEPLQAAQSLGLDVIIIDHHIAEAHLPPAVAIINPNRLDEESPLKYLAAVGVSFLFVVALNRVLRHQNWYTPQRPEPDLLQWLDLVALGTVCDVVPLIGLNRAYVSQGLKVMARRRNLGLTTLADTARLYSAPDAYHLGFLLGPRINAGGRVSKADLGCRLLTSDDPITCQQIAHTLDTLNGERQQIEHEVYTAALAQIETEHLDHASVIVVAGKNWHPGVIGIVAGRLKEKFHRPTCVIGIDETNQGKGSGRSIPGIDLGRLIHNARTAGILTQGGGHAMAAGFSIESTRIDALREFMARHTPTEEQIQKPSLKIDGALALSGVSLELLHSLEQLSPHGAGNPSPRFAFGYLRVTWADTLRSSQSDQHGHIKCTLMNEQGQRLEGIAFRAAGQPLGDFLLTTGREYLIHVAGSLKINTWQGQQKIQLIIEDAAPISASSSPLKSYNTTF